MVNESEEVRGRERKGKAYLHFFVLVLFLSQVEFFQELSFVVIASCLCACVYMCVSVRLWCMCTFEHAMLHASAPYMCTRTWYVLNTSVCFVCNMVTGCVL